jgi:hypothetical protein
MRGFADAQRFPVVRQGVLERCERVSPRGQDSGRDVDKKFMVASGHLHGVPLLDQHVVRMPYANAVDEDIRDGAQSLEHQARPTPGSLHRLESRMVEVVAVLRRVYLPHVQAEEWLTDHPGSLRVQLQRVGYPRLQRWPTQCGQVRRATGALPASSASLTYTRCQLQTREVKSIRSKHST